MSDFCKKLEPSLARMMACVRKCDLLLIVPPYCDTDKPSLGLHILQACCAERGIRAQVVYANLIWEECIGKQVYGSICRASGSELWGERSFALAAFQIPWSGDEITPQDGAFKRSPKDIGFRLETDWRKLALEAVIWADRFSAALASTECPVVGCTTMFEQTTAAISILQRLKAIRPEITTLLGGSNCEAGMADGLATFTQGVDFIFSGECETALVDFMLGHRQGIFPNSKIVQGQTCKNLDALPCPDFTDFFSQHKAVFGISSDYNPDQLWMTYETSRGCWWGQKRQCTFCGINGTGMRFREKSASRVLADLQTLCLAHKSNKICMVDNIMPYRYFDTLLPRLESEMPGLHIFFEQKANLSFSKVFTIKRAGINVIQPGIEALQDDLLILMKKGVTAAQNIALLRQARSVGLAVNWNILYGFPGDQVNWYEETLRILPLITHLHPPAGIFRLSIDRFSPYFEDASRYSITNIRPLEGYQLAFPQYADISKTAYYFNASYESGSLSHPEIIDQISKELAAWRSSWIQKPAAPALAVVQIEHDAYMLIDSRPAFASSPEIIDENRAMLVLFGAQQGFDKAAQMKWALERGLVFQLNKTLIPLAITDPALFERLSLQAANKINRVETSNSLAL